MSSCATRKAQARLSSSPLIRSATRFRKSTAASGVLSDGCGSKHRGSKHRISFSVALRAYVVADMWRHTFGLPDFCPIARHHHRSYQLGRRRSVKASGQQPQIRVVRYWNAVQPLHILACQQVEWVMCVKSLRGTSDARPIFATDDVDVRLVGVEYVVGTSKRWLHTAVVWYRDGVRRLLRFTRWSVGARRSRHG